MAASAVLLAQALEKQGSWCKPRILRCKIPSQIRFGVAVSEDDGFGWEIPMNAHKYPYIPLNKYNYP